MCHYFNQKFFNYGESLEVYFKIWDNVLCMNMNKLIIVLNIQVSLFSQTFFSFCEISLKYGIVCQRCWFTSSIRENPINNLFILRVDKGIVKALMQSNLLRFLVSHTHLRAFFSYSNVINSFCANQFYNNQQI